MSRVYEVGRSIGMHKLTRLLLALALTATTLLAGCAERGEEDDNAVPGVNVEEPDNDRNNDD